MRPDLPIAARTRKVGIVAVACRLMIDLWRYLDAGVMPAGAALLDSPKGGRLRYVPMTKRTLEEARHGRTEQGARAASAEVTRRLAGLYGAEALLLLAGV